MTLTRSDTPMLCVYFHFWIWTPNQSKSYYLDSPLNFSVIVVISNNRQHRRQHRRQHHQHRRQHIHWHTNEDHESDLTIDLYPLV